MSEKRFVDLLPQPLRPWAEKAVAWAKGLSKPARVLVIGTLVALVAIGGFIGFRSSNPPYTVLFTNLEHDDAAAVVAKLKEMKVPYRLEGDGGVVEVPESQARELRLELAGAGLPRGGAVGFESFDKMRLGATEFEQRILYRRALEGELSRTIGTVAAIQSARVHLVLPEKSVFVSKNEPSSASVVLKLRGGRALGPGEVAGIVHLVSTSVAGLTPDRVAVVTTEGLVLHKPKRANDDGGDEDRLTQTRSLEATLEERARAMVEKVTGAGHVDVRVSADIDTARLERVEDHYDPKQTALRSEERSVERNGGTEVPVAGIPGAESNLPGGAKPTTAAAAAAGADGGVPAPATSTDTATAGVVRESHTRNFEVDHVTEKRIVTGGVLRRLTVAVVLDSSPSVVGGPSRSKEEIDKIASLVKSSIGFDERRGDLVTVEAVPFLAAEAAPAPPPPPNLLPFTLPKDPKKLGAIGGGILAAVILLTVLSLRRGRRKKAVRLKLAHAAAKEKASAEAALAEITTPAELPEESSDELRRQVRELAQLDPATAALIVRGWLGSADATREQAA